MSYIIGYNILLEENMDNTRRDFLKTAGIPLAAATIMGVGSATSAAAQEADMMGELTEHKLPELPYAYDALEPYIDAQTMEIHHSRHHQGYVNGLIAAEKALAQARAENDFALIEYWSKKLAFNGGGHLLHSLFWSVMAPHGDGGGGEPTGALARRINRDFGSFDAFKAHFSAAAGAVEGSGWGVLHYRPMDDRLIVMQVENQHKLTQWASVPVLGIDVWEHAYYLKYQNNRGEYINQWWNVVNWEQVARNVEKLAELRD